MTIELAVKVRRPATASDESNLFVRLSTETAKDLHRQALSTSQVAGSANSACWFVTSDRSSACASGVEFLPLQIELPGGDIVYASYNGGDADEDGIIDVRQDLLVVEGMVKVKPLSSVRNASSIVFQVDSVADYDELRRHADWLEGGALLQQISIVYPGQNIQLRTRNGTVKVKVFGENFCSRKSVWPDDDCDSNLPPCLRLIASTEIIIQPTGTSSEQNVARLRLVDVKGDFPSFLHDAAEKLGIMLCGVLSRSALVHPSTMEKMCKIKGLGACKYAKISIDQGARQETILRILQTRSVGENEIALETILKEQWRLCDKDCAVQISLLSDSEVNEMRKNTWLYLRSREASMKLITSATNDKHLPGYWPKLCVSHQAQECGIRRLARIAEGIPESISDFPITFDHFFCFSLADELSVEASPLAFRFVVDSRQSPEKLMLIMAKDLKDLIQILPQMSEIGKEYSITLAPRLIKDIPSYSIAASKLLSHFPLKESCSAMVISGRKGGGKTHSALIVASLVRMHRKLPITYLDCVRLRESYGKRMEDMLRELSTVIESSTKDAAILIIDDIDAVCPHFESSAVTSIEDKSEIINPVAVSQAKLTSDYALSLLRQSEKAGSFVILTDSGPSATNSAIRNTFRYAEHLTVPLLDDGERCEMFKKLLRGELSRRYAATNDLLNTIPSDSPKRIDSLSLSDIHRLVVRICERRDLSSISEAISAELDDFTPSEHLSASVEDGDPRSCHLGGLFAVRSELDSVLLRPLRYSRIYSKSKVSLPRGLLLFGPPGCGKTHTIPFMARQTGLPIISCRGPELLDKYIGSSEKNVRKLFARAYSVAPSILFIDELDSLAPRRGSDHTGVTDRIVNQMLTFLDGVEGAEAEVYIIGATSRPDKVDPALLRPGRLERHIYVGFPTSFEEWADILLASSKSFPLAMNTEEWIRSGGSRQLYDKYPHLHSLSAADIHAAFCSARINAVTDAMSKKSNMETVAIEFKHVISALERTRPSLPTEERRRFEAYHSRFRPKLHHEAADRENASEQASGLKTLLK